MTAYPDAATVKMVAGMTQRVKAAAERASQAPAEWLRGVIRRAVEASERQHRRRKASK